MEIPGYTLEETDDQSTHAVSTETRSRNRKRNQQDQENKAPSKDQAPKVPAFQPSPPKPREPIIGFGDTPPAFMKNYFPDVPAGFVRKI